MFGSLLLRLARKVVENVMSQLMQQFNVVQEMAADPLKGIIQEITGGVWTGQAADALVEEVSSLMLPNVGRIGDTITKYHSDLKRAVDVIDQADKQVNSAVNNLSDIFGGIFAG